MELTFAASGFIGAWLLFAGPIWQASLELREEQLDRNDFAGYDAGFEPEPEPSWWWWAVPPIAYVKWRARAQRARRRWVLTIPIEQRERMFSFLNKSAGWLFVSAGAFFIGCKESWELVEAIEWPAWSIVPLIVVPALMSVAYTINRTRRTEKGLAAERRSAPGAPTA